MKITLTLDAEEDIKSIIDYTIAQFGLVQAEKYYNGMDTKFSSIAEGTAHSQDYTFVRNELKRTNYQSHAIYYRIVEEREILILHVLHQSMDELKHLRE